MAVGNRWVWSYLEEGSQVKVWCRNIPSMSLVPSSGWREGQHDWMVVSEGKIWGRCDCQEGNIQIK